MDIDLAIDLPTKKASQIFGKGFSSTGEWGFLAYQEYAVRKEKHYCYLVVHHRKRRPSKKKAELHVHITIRMGERQRLTRIKEKLTPALDFLESHPELLKKNTADVRASYFYSTKKYFPVPDLPTPYPLAGFEGAEIAGLRINFKEKHLAGRPQVSIIVEMVPRGRIHHNVNFSYMLSDVSKSLDTVLTLSRVISRKFVREKTS